VGYKEALSPVAQLAITPAMMINKERPCHGLEAHYSHITLHHSGWLYLQLETLPQSPPLHSHTVEGTVTGWPGGVGRRE